MRTNNRFAAYWEEGGLVTTHFLMQGYVPPENRLPTPKDY
jgi:hypothetical protein